MKAVQINKYGPSDVLEVADNVSKPSPAEGQVLIAVKAASINPIDWKIREGMLKERMELAFPVTMGGDFSGVVVEIGDGDIGFSVGDEVFGQGGIYNGGSGSLAEFVAATVGKTAPKPKNVDFATAAALPLVGVSALQGIMDHIKIKSEQKILILGGAGGIGHMAVQMAKAYGAHVVTTAAADDFDYVKGLGADEAIDYRASSSFFQLPDFDAVFDTSGKGVGEKLFKVIKRGGIIVSMTDEPSAELAKKYGLVVMRQSTDSNPERLVRLTQLVENGKVKVHVDKVFALSEVKEAFDHLEKGHPRGKVVLVT